MTLPCARKRPCGGCPWRRSSIAGWLGPFDAEEWVALARSDEPIACHESIEVDGEWTENTLQCAGAAIFRGNTAKSPRNPEVAKFPPNTELVFGRATEFLDHHERNG